MEIETSKQDFKVIQPFEKIDGLDKRTYLFRAVSSEKKELIDKKKYLVRIEYGAYDNLIMEECECKGFQFRDNCKHIKLCQSCLKSWGEL